MGRGLLPGLRRFIAAGALLGACTVLPPRAVAVPRSDAPQRYAAAVAAYEGGRHEEAASLFRQMVVEGQVHPNVLMGLGNASFRLQRWVDAVYAYEWASRLAPADPDILENLRLARAHLVADEIPTDASPAMQQMQAQLARIPARWTMAGFAVLWTLGWLLLALRQVFVAEGATWLAMLLLLLALPLAGHVAFQVASHHGPPQGLLQSPQVEVRSGPGAEYATLFTLHAGTVVEDREERQGWRRVGVPHGPDGWVPAESVAVFGQPETLQAH